MSFPGFDNRSVMPMGPGGTDPYLGSMIDGMMSINAGTPQPLPGVSSRTLFFEKSQHADGLINGPVNQHLPLNLTQNPKHDSAKGELVFVMHNPKFANTSDGAHQVRSLSSLNRHMMMPAMRRKYGSSTSAESLTRHVSFLGIQQHDFMGYPEHDQVMTFHTGGVVEHVYNIWNAAPRWDARQRRWLRGRDIAVDDRLWLVWIRKPYKPPYDMKRTSSSIRRIEDDYHDIEATTNTSFGLHTNKSRRFRADHRLSTFDDSDMEPSELGKGSEEYMWQLVPVVTELGQDVPTSLYFNDKFQGSRICVGKVVHLYGNHFNAAARLPDRLLKAIHPESSDDSYRFSLYQGNTVSVALRVD